MDLEEIKAKFRHKTSLDIKDLDLALSALPLLVRELESREKELQEFEKRVEHLAAQLKRRPPLARKGNRGDAGWEVKMDEKENRFHLLFSGRFTYTTAKLASNATLIVLENAREDFDVIADLSQLHPDYDRKVVFHLRKILYHMKTMGIRRLVRVFGSDDPKLARLLEDKQLSQENRSFVAHSREDAVKLLDSLGRFLKA